MAVLSDRPDRARKRVAEADLCRENPHCSIVFAEATLSVAQTTPAPTFVQWLVTALYGHERDEHTEFVHGCAREEPPTGIPSQIAAILVRHASLAAVVMDYYRAFRFESRQTPYPLEAIRRLDGPDRTG